MPVTLSYDGRNKHFAQKLRREMTKQERHLWYDYLSTTPVRFRRQKQFGYYIVDFYCAERKLVIEIDGSQHYEPEEKMRDERRTAYLTDLGLQVLRFSNHDVDTRFREVCETIDRIFRVDTEGGNDLFRPALRSVHLPLKGKAFGNPAKYKPLWEMTYASIQTAL